MSRSRARSWRVGLVWLGLGVMLWHSPAHAGSLPDSLPDSLTVSMEPQTSSVVLGESFGITVTVGNRGSDLTVPLVVHLDITNPDETTSVDPEDWTGALTQPIGSLAPGATASVQWELQPIASGTFSAFAVVLGSGVDSVAASNVLEVRVADRRTLDPGGILPVALAVPGCTLALLLLQRGFARRTGR